MLKGHNEKAAKNYADVLTNLQEKDSQILGL